MSAGAPLPADADLPLGFTYSGVHAGVKAHRKDLALIRSDPPAEAAGTVTRNQLRAACASRTARLLPRSGVRAIVVNSGNANCLSGPDEARADERLAEAAAAALGADPDDVVTASTGGIGTPLPMDKLLAAMPALVAGLSPSPGAAAEAILTTDRCTKLAWRRIEVGGRPVRVFALAKGAGMIHPDMATMLAFVCTDAACPAADLAEVLGRVVPRTFNQLSVDRDTSTNDAVVLLANGVAGVAVDAANAEFAAAVEEVCLDVARQMGRDGEGATRLVRVEVRGAPDQESARLLSRAVVESNLWKCSVFGGSAGWPRALAALGARAATLGLEIARDRIRFTVDGAAVVEGGHPTGREVVVRNPDLELAVDLGLGEAAASSWGCDLTYEYISINSMTKADPLETQSPGLKRRLLVEALSYIRRFSGKLAVIKYGGAAMLREDLRNAFAEDLVLLKAAGLLPVVVHGGGPEISRTLEKLGEETRFVDGLRYTDEASVKIVEMVLTGKVNTDVVTRIHTHGGRAIGVSGKDGALLTARKLELEGKDLGMVGDVEEVRTEIITMLLDGGYIPVISPIGVSREGQTYNINADTVAAKIAAALGAEKVIFLTDVPGILREGELVQRLESSAARRLLEDGTITGGMIPKVTALLAALAEDVKSAHVIDGRVPHNLLAELFTDQGVGTFISAD